MGKRIWEVIPATKGAVDKQFIHTGKRMLPMGNQKILYLKDAGEARAIQQSVGQDGTGQFMVTSHEEPPDRLHPMRMVMPKKTWTSKPSDKGEWVEVSAGRWRWVEKDKDNGV